MAQRNSFTYDVYVNGDVRQAAAAIELFNANGAHIKLLNKGNISLSWQGMPPYDIRSMMDLPNEIQDLNSFSLILTSKPFSRPYSINDYKAAISTQAYHGIVNIEPSLFLAYFIALAILHHEAKYNLDDPYAADGPGAIEIHIKDGYIPPDLLKAFDRSISNDASLSILKSSIKSVINAVKSKLSKNM